MDCIPMDLQEMLIQVRTVPPNGELKKFVHEKWMEWIEHEREIVVDELIECIRILFRVVASLMRSGKQTDSRDC